MFTASLQLSTGACFLTCILLTHVHSLSLRAFSYMWFRLGSISMNSDYNILFNHIKVPSWPWPPTPLNSLCSSHMLYQHEPQSPSRSHTGPWIHTDTQTHTQTYIQLINLGKTDRSGRQTGRQRGLLGRGDDDRVLVWAQNFGQVSSHWVLIGENLLHLDQRRQTVMSHRCALVSSDLKFSDRKRVSVNVTLVYARHQLLTTLLNLRTQQETMSFPVTSESSLQSSVTVEAECCRGNLVS